MDKRHIFRLGAFGARFGGFLILGTHLSAFLSTCAFVYYLITHKGNNVASIGVIVLSACACLSVLVHFINGWLLQLLGTESVELETWKSEFWHGFTVSTILWGAGGIITGLLIGGFSYIAK